MKISIPVIIGLLGYGGAAWAGEADVIDVTVTDGGEKFGFSVTVRHDDTGWDHYANKWEVLDAKGKLLGERILAHPHVNEQPFTRSGSISIPAGVKSVIVRAHDSVHGYGGREMTVELPGR